MRIESTSPDADARVMAWVIQRYRSAGQGGRNKHLKRCPDITVEYEGFDGEYGCDTGCEYARFEATVTCPHGEREADWCYGEFGELGLLLRSIIAIETGPVSHD